MKLILKDPKKNFGKVEFWEGDVAATLLATWYKSPPLCIETYEEDAEYCRGGCSRTILATYHKVGTYNIFEHNFPAVIEDEEDDDPLIGAERGGKVEKTSPRRQGSEIQEGKDSEAQPSPYIPDSDDLGDKGHKAFGI